MRSIAVRVFVEFFPGMHRALSFSGGDPEKGAASWPSGGILVGLFGVFHGVRHGILGPQAC